MPNRDPNTIATVHRFGESVAVRVGNGDVTYLSRHQAAVLSDALARCCKNIADKSFRDSEFGTINIGRDPSQRGQDE